LMAAFHKAIHASHCDAAGMPDGAVRSTAEGLAAAGSSDRSRGA
jgi:hypothetical protein